MTKYKEIVFFDTETTGKGETARLCQLAYIHQSVEGEDIGNLNEYFNPQIPIEFEAMAVHHITNDMVAGKPVFMESEHYAEVKKLFEREDVLVVAHNAKFDLGKLATEDIVPENVICTLKLARHFDPDGKLTSHSLQYLRYCLALPCGNLVAHDAYGDVCVLVELFERFKAKGVSFEEMITISSKPSLIPRFKFGKHKGKLIRETDPGYLRWLLDSESSKSRSERDEDMIYTLNEALA